MKKYLGIEFGSTRIKGVLIDGDHQIIASGSFTWENQLVHGVWTYSLEDAKAGLRHCYRELKADYEAKHKEKLTHIDAIGISGMMHGYLVLDKKDRQLAEFRTWRNTITERASALLTEAFGFQVPQRWSISHVYQAILNQEKEVKDIAFSTTLAGYFHYLMTGKKVLGVGEASGMAPIDPATKSFDLNMLHTFDKMVDGIVPWKVENIFPKVLVAGEEAGRLSEEGRDLLDESKELETGIPFCPPEGDMGTGMVCTHSVRTGTGNASIGTSSNLTLVTNAKIGVYKEIDVISSPSGINAALIHVNNGTSGINAWERLFKEVASHFNKEVQDKDVYSYMFQEALKGDPSCKGITPVDYFSGEPITHVNEGKLLLLREPDAKMDLPNFARAHIYSLLGTIRLGADILRQGEGVKLDKVVGHGGFFKTPKVGATLLSASLGVPVATLESAGEGGPYGEALLAAYMIQKKPGETLEDYLDAVFARQGEETCMASVDDIDGFNLFLVQYKKALHVEKSAIEAFKNPAKPQGFSELKKRVYEANMRLPKEGLVALTFGNASEIDREAGVFGIKPSGVPYEKLRPEDIVIVDLDGRVVEGDLRPSSDTPTHAELYRSFPNIGGIVHTHSSYATAFAQARKSIMPFGTTHADLFYGDIPCTRPLTKKEIENDYERHTGTIIVETFKSRDYISTPGVLVASHGPFSWGKDAKEAVDNAKTLEEVAKLTVLTIRVDPDASPISQHLAKKHHERKHGNHAYYGQKEN